MGESRRPHPQQTAEKLLARAERDRRIVELKRRGRTYAEIAFEVGCDKNTARVAFMAAVREAAADRFTETALYVAEHMEQLGALLDAVWDRAMRGDDKATAEARRIIMAMADLDGSKAPVKHEFGESDLDRSIRELGEVLNRRAAAAEGQDAHAALDAGAGEATHGG
jgi:hypothetical protein